MTNVAIYARVSKDKENSNGIFQDPENQLSPLRQFAKNMGYNVSAEFVDYASGGSSNRPEFQRMLSRVKQKHFDIVLIWSLDRFSREGMLNTLSYTSLLKSYNTGLYSLQEPWLNSKEEVNDLLIGVLSWIAQREKDRIGERTKAGLAKLKETKDYKEGTKKLGRPWPKKGALPS